MKELLRNLYMKINNYVLIGKKLPELLQFCNMAFFVFVDHVRVQKSIYTRVYASHFKELHESTLHILFATVPTN